MSSAEIFYLADKVLNLVGGSKFGSNLSTCTQDNQNLLNTNYHNLRDILSINSMENVINVATRNNAILDPIIIYDDMHHENTPI